MLHYSIRFIRPKEISFLQQMFYEAIYLPPEEKKQLPFNIIFNSELLKYHEEWGRRGDIALVVEQIETKQKLACIWGRLFAKDNPGYGFVDEVTPEISLAVKEEYRNKGIGTELLSAICDEYRKQGYKQLSLSSDKRNPSVRLYHRIGFQTITENENDYLMVLKLNDKKS